MNFLKSIWSFLFGWIREEDVQSIIKAVIIQIINQQYGRVTRQNRSAIFSDTVSELEKQGLNTKKHHRLIAEAINQQLDFQIAKTDNNRRGSV